MTRTSVAQVSSLACAVHISHHSRVIFMRPSCCLILRNSPLLAAHVLSHRLVFPPGHQLLLSRCGGQIPCALPLMRTLAPLPNTTLSQVMSPTSSTISTTQRPLIFSSRSNPSDTRPSYLHDAELSDTIGKALSSPLFTQEREDPASRRQAYHSLEESSLSSQSLSVGHVRTGRLVSDDFGHSFQTSDKNHVVTQKVSKSGFFWNDKRSKILLIVEQRFTNTSTKPIVTEKYPKIE